MYNGCQSKYTDAMDFWNNANTPGYPNKTNALINYELQLPKIQNCVNENVAWYYRDHPLQTPQELNIHNDINSQPNNMNYPKIYRSPKYDYKGCWAGDGGQVLPKDYGSVATGVECYVKAYNGNNKYFGLRDGKCFASNSNEENYKAEDNKGFTDRCQGHFGIINQNQIYELRYNLKDEQPILNKLQTI